MGHRCFGRQRVFDFFARHFKRFGGAIDPVQHFPLGGLCFGIGARRVDHHAHVRIERTVANRGGLRLEVTRAIGQRLQAHQHCRAIRLPGAQAAVARSRFKVGQGQRAMDEFFRRFNLHKIQRFAHQFEHLEQHRRLDRGAGQKVKLRAQLRLCRGRIGQRQGFEPVGALFRSAECGRH